MDAAQANEAVRNGGLCLEDLGRAHRERAETGLDGFELDRRRVVHSAAFRRLLDKTQVFVAAGGDHERTRLTHTLEVGQLTRRLALALGLDETLAETIALAHDLGHPPFGHAGEKALDACLQGHGGFEHNLHALRVVEYLEHPYPAFRGLNLTRVVRECLAKHTTSFDRPGRHPLQDGRAMPLEGRIVDLADRLTYTFHDLQDGVYAGLITPDDLRRVAPWRAAIGSAEIADGRALRRLLRPTLDKVEGWLVEDCVGCVRREAARSGVVRLRHARLGFECLLSDEGEAGIASFEHIVRERVYRNDRVRAMDQAGGEMIERLFAAYAARPTELPDRYVGRMREQGVERVVADYIAGMTDGFCRSEYARICAGRPAACEV